MYKLIPMKESFQRYLEGRSIEELQGLYNLDPEYRRITKDEIKAHTEKLTDFLKGSDDIILLLMKLKESYTARESCVSTMFYLRGFKDAIDLLQSLNYDGKG